MKTIVTKSMAEILKDYPNAYFTQSGLLRDDSWPIWISTSQYMYLGKEIELNDRGFDEIGNLWHPQWVKPTNQGKYAYNYIQFPGDGPETETTLFFDDPNIKNDWLTRAPEKDLKDAPLSKEGRNETDCDTRPLV